MVPGDEPILIRSVLRAVQDSTPLSAGDTRYSRVAPLELNRTFAIGDYQQEAPSGAGS